MADVSGFHGRMKLLILIPAHNEEKAIGQLIQQLVGMSYQCLVIDDGSADLTAKIAAQSGAIVVSTGRKSGKGSALRLGFKHALQWDYEAIMMMDADGQHAPGDIATFIDVYQKTGADIINGNRLHNPLGMPWIRLMTNKFMSWLISSLCRRKIEDTQCGFRLITIKALRQLDLKSNDFEIETEMLVQSAKKGFQFASANIQTIYEDEVSKIRPVKDTFRFIRYLCREFIKRP